MINNYIYIKKKCTHNNVVRYDGLCVCTCEGGGGLEDISTILSPPSPLNTYITLYKYSVIIILLIILLPANLIRFAANCLERKSAGRLETTHQQLLVFYIITTNSVVDHDV